MAATVNVSPSSLPAVEPALYEGRVSRIAFEALVGIFFGLAIITASIRLILQIRIYRRLYLDDYFLILACVCLTAGTVLGYANAGNLYWSEELNYNPSRIYYLLAENVNIADHINAPLVIYWRFVVGIAIVSLPVCIITIYVTCIKWGLEAATCLEPVYFHRALGVAIFDIILDIGTDLLLVSIPIRLLWFERIRPRQKAVLGLFLSLNLFMAITAAIRVSGLKFRGTFDEVWLFLWQQIEACVAVAMISLTAFRSVFIGSESSRERRVRAKKAWYSSTMDVVKRNRKQRCDDEEASRELPAIPSATLTGIRTFIQAGDRTRTSHPLTSCTSTAEWESAMSGHPTGVDKL